MTIKITKKQKLLEVNNCYAHNFYYLIHGQIISDDKKYMKRFKFVLFFDVFDLCEYIEKDRYTKADLQYFIDDMIPSYTDLINSFDDCADFYDLCNETIIKYNGN